MSDCGFCIEADYDGSCDFTYQERPKARKRHRCSECGRFIEPGNIYHLTSGKYEGELFRDRTCLECSEIRQAFSCGGWVVGVLWENMEDWGFERLTTGCLQKLETAAAKQFLLNKWNEWKFRELP